MNTTLFNILLLFVGLSGLTACIHFIYKSNKNKKNTLWAFVFFVFWIVLGIILMFTFILKEQVASIKYAYLIVLNTGFTITSLFSAFYANILASKLEKILEKGTKLTFYVLRIVVLLYASICMDLSLNISKSILYELEVASYEFDEYLSKMIEEATGEEVSLYKTEKTKFEQFYKDVSSIDKQTLNYTKKNIFSWLSGNYIIEKESTEGFGLQYDFRRGGAREANITIHQVVYKPANIEMQCFVNLSSNRGKLKNIDKAMLLETIERRIHEEDLQVEIVVSKPANIQNFAFVSTLKTLGVEKYEFWPADKKTKKIELYLHWIFYLIGAAIFFEFGRSWSKDEH